MTRVFQKPKVVDETRIKDLEIRYKSLKSNFDSLETDFENKKRNLEKSFLEIKSGKENEIKAFDEVLKKKRDEFRDLNRPLDEKREELGQLSAKLNSLSSQIDIREQLVLERETKAENLISDSQDLIDKTSEKQLEVVSRERMSKVRENQVVAKELIYLTSVEAFSSKVDLKEFELDEREKAVSLREINIVSQTEVNKKKEKEFRDTERRINDKYLEMLKAKKELQAKK